jgi:hypothetical protein
MRSCWPRRDASLPKALNHSKRTEFGKRLFVRTAAFLSRNGLSTPLFEELSDPHAQCGVTPGCFEVGLSIALRDCVEQDLYTAPHGPTAATSDKLAAMLAVKGFTRVRA